ncbi:hypothetical protein AgCh_010358 [Apium graveolens]
MNLEDFFTLTEMKDGLTAPARVKELINVLQKDQQRTVKNVSDLTRQWSAVASTIASTENNDCLALFLQLGGLCYFDTWLKHSQKCFQETGDNFIEESIIVLLGAIEKLHREEQMSVISGTMMTVKDLLRSNSSRVQNKARALLDSWKQNDASNVVQKDVDEDMAVCDVVDVNENPISKHKEPNCSSLDISTSKGINSEEKNFEPATDEIMPAICPETMRTEAVVDLTMGPSEKTLDHASPHPVHSCTLKLLSKNSSVLENPSEHKLESTTGIESSGSAFLEPRTLKGKLNVANSNEHDEAKQMLQIRSCNNLGLTGTFCADNGKTVEVVADNEKDIDVVKGDPCLKTNSFGDVRKEVSDEADEMYDSISPNPCSKISASDSTAPVDVLQDSSLSDFDMGKNEGVNSNLSGKDDTDTIDESNEQNVSKEVEIVGGNVDSTADLSRKEDTEAIEAIELSNGQKFSDKHEVNWGNEDLTTNLLRKENAETTEEANSQSVSGEDEVVSRNDPEFYMSGADSKHSVEKKSEFQLDYDMFDPLEVARQVAIEVEREMDCREPSCSSSERTSGDGMRLPESPNSPKGNMSTVIHQPCKDVSTGPNLSVVEDRVFVKAKNLPSEREDGIVDIEPTEVTDVAQKLEPDEDKHVCCFDLNEDVMCDDDTDNQTNPVTAPISLESSSRVAVTSGLPSSPFPFDGTHGWKGSAETSAFRPSPTGKVSEGGNSIFASGSSSSLFRRQEYLDFDLNVAETEEYIISELPPNKETSNLTVRPSGECSVESCPKRSDLLQLDLNCVSDSGDAPLSYWRKEERVLPHCNGQFSPSASSSTSSRQPALKNIDFNEQPSPFIDFLHPSLTAKSSPNMYASGFGEFKTKKSVISLMGARVDVSQEDNVPQTIPFLNGRIVDPAVVASVTRNDGVLGLASSSLHAHSYMHGYNGLPSGPTVPYSSGIHGLGGQIPYMVDSRGTPIVPQVSGPVPALTSTFPQQPSFSESLFPAPADNNRLVPSRHGFDLNSGLMFEGISRNAGNTMQLFSSGKGISMEDQMRANSQSTSGSGVGGKRKEIDGGWDPYPFSNKYHQPQWK